MKRLLYAVIMIFTLSAMSGCGSSRKADTSNVETTEAKTESDDEVSTEQSDNAIADNDKADDNDPAEHVGTSLLEFYNDPELDDWFDSIAADPPVKLTYRAYSYGGDGDNFEIEVKDQGMIITVAKALLTVKIGSETDYDVLDGGGKTYIFEMKDGTTREFDFDNDMIESNKGKLHEIASYGELTEISKRLRDGSDNE